MKKRTLIVTACIVLVLALAIGGTMAWLQDVKSANQNFYGEDQVHVALSPAEGGSTKVIPGQKVAFNPSVSVDASVDAFAFVQIVDADNLLGTPVMASGWTALNGVDGVYYRTVSASNESQSFNVFNGGQVQISPALTNETIVDLNADVQIRALAIQAQWLNGEETGSTAAEAWAILNP